MAEIYCAWRTGFSEFVATFFVVESSEFKTRTSLMMTAHNQIEFSRVRRCHPPRIPPPQTKTKNLARCIYVHIIKGPIHTSAIRYVNEYRRSNWNHSIASTPINNHTHVTTFCCRLQFCYYDLRLLFVLLRSLHANCKPLALLLQ